MTVAAEHPRRDPEVEGARVAVLGEVDVTDDPLCVAPMPRVSANLPRSSMRRSFQVPYGPDAPPRYFFAPVRCRCRANSFAFIGSLLA